MHLFSETVSRETRLAVLHQVGTHAERRGDWESGFCFPAAPKHLRVDVLIECGRQAPRVSA